MNSHIPTRSEEVTVRHRATSAQPPHTTSPFLLWPSFRHASHPSSSTVLLDTPGVLLEGLRCFPADSPLPETTESHGKNRSAFHGDFQ
jgi:hypothetical protein